MSKSKKILSIALALVMALSVFAIGAFAVQTTPTATVTVAVDNVSVGNSETVTVTIKAVSAEDYYAGPMSLPLTYDTTLFTLGTVTVADVFGAGVTEKITNTATAGKVIVTIVPKTDGSPVAPNLNGNETVLATITFTSAASPATGTGTFAIDDDQKTTTNPNGKFYMGSFDGSDPKTAELTTMGQTLNRVDTAVNVGVAGAPELILTATGESYGTVIRDDLCTTDYDGCVFGIPTLDGEAIEDYVTTVVGSIEVVENANGEFTTGAEILLKDAGGNVVATYVFIYFGDVNGDAAVDISDAGDVEAHDQWVATIDDDTAAYYAADVNADGTVDISDAGDIEAHDQWLVTLPDQCDIAADFTATW